MPRKCSALTKGGTPCKANALAESEFCSFHDPTRAQVIQGGREKGANTPTLPRLRLARLPMGDADELLAVLEDGIAAAREHGSDPERLCYLQTSAVKAAVSVMEYKRRRELDGRGDPPRVDFLRQLAEQAQAATGEDPDLELDLDELPDELRAAVEEHLAKRRRSSTE